MLATELLFRRVAGVSVRCLCRRLIKLVVHLLRLDEKRIAYQFY